MIQTDYAIHDGVYARKRHDGTSIGWNDATGTELQLRRLAAWVGDRPPGRILELGCGAGDQSLWFAERGFQVVGIDISLHAIDWARDKADSRELIAEFALGSVLDLPFEDASFDYVLDGACWHCIVGEDRRTFLAEAARVLRPGGIFTGITMVNDNRLPDPVGYDRERHLQFMNGVAVRYWTRTDEALADLRMAGLEVTRFQETPADDAEQMEDMLFVDAMRPR
ncbi:MAG: class I SAM-dependent methyltransferase [Fimbriimonas sp.]